MTENQKSELAQLRWRCRRGMLELDLLLNTFIEKKYRSLDVAQIELFEILLDYPDQVLFDLLMDKMQASDKNISKLVEQIRKASR